MCYSFNTVHNGTSKVICRINPIKTKNQESEKLQLSNKIPQYTLLLLYKKSLHILLFWFHFNWLILDGCQNKMHAQLWLEAEDWSLSVADPEEGPGGTPPSPPPPYFWTKLRPEQPKKFFWETSPPSPYLKVWTTGLPLILRSGSGTAFVPGTKHLIRGGNKTSYHCNRTAVKTLRLWFLGKPFLG